jgi:hypothetical protein
MTDSAEGNNPPGLRQGNPLAACNGAPPPPPPPPMQQEQQRPRPPPGAVVSPPPASSGPDSSPAAVASAPSPPKSLVALVGKAEKAAAALAAGSMHHGDSFGVYMHHKNLKLREQFEAQALGQAQLSDVFRGVTIHVNGFTVGGGQGGQEDGGRGRAKGGSAAGAVGRGEGQEDGASVVARALQRGGMGCIRRTEAVRMATWLKQWRLP